MKALYSTTQSARWHRQNTWSHVGEATTGKKTQDVRAPFIRHVMSEGICDKKVYTLWRMWKRSMQSRPDKLFRPRFHFKSSTLPTKWSWLGCYAISHRSLFRFNKTEWDNEKVQVRFRHRTSSWMYNTNHYEWILLLVLPEDSGHAIKSYSVFVFSDSDE